MATELHLLMHAAAIRKHGAATDIAAIAGLPGATAAAALGAACAGGRLAEVDGKYLLTPAGQMIVAAEYSRFWQDLRADADFVAAYERFEIINRELKQVITRWQTMELGGKTVANDHSDKDYDEAVIGQLGDLHEKFEPVLDALVRGDARFGIYKSKLGEALEKAEDGDIEWVSDARIDSYHTVWFELHEDLLRVLGRVREE
ncbi:MAG: hypothetical protein H6977_03545 [Gammaproteobacteria bacterium]|nr:hypothetical protein [Gammaproteobacteria bacterium]